MRTTTKRSAGVASVVVGLIGLSIAFAAWTSTGEGSGNVTAGTAEPLTVEVTGISGLYPTGTVQVPYTVTNDNDYAVALDTVTLKSITADEAAVTAGCDATVVTGTGTVSEVLAANSASTGLEFPLTMSNAADDGCQGATFTVTLEVSGQSSS